MKSRPNVHWAPRVAKDIRRCIEFIGRQPWGKPMDRARDILKGINEAVEWPTLRPVSAFRPESGLELRCHYAAQFVIVYAYVEPDLEHSAGQVSIRAVRHRRVKDVLKGVRENGSRYGAAIQLG